MNYMTVENCKVLYQDYLRKKIQVEAGTTYEFNPLLGKRAAHIPNLDQLKYFKGKFEGFLLAHNWLFDDKSEKELLIIRRASFNPLMDSIKDTNAQEAFKDAKNSKDIALTKDINITKGV